MSLELLNTGPRKNRMGKMPDPFVGERDKFPAYLSHLTNSAAASKEHSALY